MRKTGLIATLLLMCTFIFSANAVETWVKVTEEPESWEGDYLIVSGDYAFDGSFVAEFGLCQLVMFILKIIVTIISR